MATASNKSRSDTGGFLGGKTGNETKGAGQEQGIYRMQRKCSWKGKENEGIEVGYKNGLAGGLIG